ncbi:MAG: rhomboid family intramembrane serine protease [Saprospiraceae bacterium]
MMQITDVVKNLLIINVIIYFGTLAIPEIVGEWFTLYSPMTEQFKPVQLITHMFMHGSPMHLFFNMFGLYMFGPPLESLWGPKKFLIFYLIAGFGAAAVHLGVSYFEYVQLTNAMSPDMVAEVLQNGRDVIATGRNYTNEALANLNISLYAGVVGASGALYGVLAGYGMKFPEAKLALIFFPVPVAAKYFIPGLLLLDLIGGFTGFSIFGQNIAHFAHIGGAIFGVLMVLFWRGTDRF